MRFSEETVVGVISRYVEKSNGEHATREFANFRDLRTQIDEIDSRDIGFVQAATVGHKIVVSAGMRASWVG